jgi:hypothetical protein
VSGLATLLDVMAQPPTVRRSTSGIRARVTAAAIGAALLLSACSVGQRAATSIEIPVVDGVQASVGPIDLRDITIATPPNGSYAAGSNARVQLVIVNEGAADKLVSVSVDPKIAAGALLFTSNFTATEAGPLPSASPSATASTSATPSASPSPTISLPVDGSIPAFDLPSGENTVIGLLDSEPVIQLMGLVSPLYPAMSIPITFTFANAGSVTVQVSVHLTTSPVNAPTLPIGPTDAP